MNWDDLRFLLAASRSGSLSKAARQLGVTHATVGRRLDRLEEALDTTLFERLPDGLRLTPTGQRYYQRASVVERKVFGFQHAVESERTALRGPVRISVSSAVLDHLVSPLLPLFYEAFPAIELDVVVGRKQLSLPRREADIGIRLTSASTDAGSPSVVIRKVGETSWKLMARRDVADTWGDTLDALADASVPVASFNDQSPFIPGEAFLNRRLPEHRVVYRCDTYEGVLHAIEQGTAYGMSFGFVMSRPDLVVLDHEPVRPMQIWVAMHPEARGNKRIDAVHRFFVDHLKADERF